MSEQSKKAGRDGLRKEINGFITISNRLPGKWITSTTAEDMWKHIDCICIGEDGKKTTYDIKAAKKANQWDNRCNYDVQWVELLNVRGNLGWLFGGADYIVFEREAMWAFIKRADIIAKIAEKIGIQNKQYTRGLELETDIRRLIDYNMVPEGKDDFELYRRKDRLDYCVRVPSEFLYNIPHFEIPKLEDKEWDAVVEKKSMREIKDDLIRIYTQFADDRVYAKDCINGFFSVRQDSELRLVYKNEIMRGLESIRIVQP